MKKKMCIDTIKNKTDITWKNYSDQVVIKISNCDIDIDLEVNGEIASQLKQALSKVA